MITYASIADRIEMMRSDLLPREGQLSFQVAARRLAAETMALREIVTFTAGTGASSSVYDPDLVEDRESVRLFKAETLVNGEWVPIPIMNQLQYSESDLRAVMENGTTIAAFTDHQGKFVPYPPPNVDTQVRADVAYKPVGDFDEVDLGPRFEDALVCGALSHYMRISGPEKSLRDAEVYESRFISELSTLKAIELVGDIGYTRGSRSRQAPIFRKTRRG